MLRSKLERVMSPKMIIIPMMIVSIFVAGSITQAAVPTSGQVGAWKFTSAPVNQSIPDSSTLDPGSYLWSVSAMIKGSGDGTIVWKGNRSDSDLYKLAISGGKATFTINSGGTGVTATAVSSASVNDGRWHMITGTRSSTKTANIYVDGVLSGTSAYTGSGSAIDTDTPLTIGSQNGADPYTGLIDQVYVFNRALAGAEISGMYATPTGGTSGTGGTAGIGGLSSPTPSPSNLPVTGCTLPSQIFNLTNWKVTLPIGSSHSPTEIFQPALGSLTNQYFKTNSSCTAVDFTAPTDGVTTSGSSYPRSELREMTDNGKSLASWGTNDGITHTMFIDEAILAVPATKSQVVAGQIHDPNDDVTVIRLDYPDLHIDLNGAAGPSLDAHYVLGRRFTVKLVAHDGRIDYYYNNNPTPVYTYVKASSGDYFKVGAYTQSNCSHEAACGPNNFGEVEVYNTWVQHGAAVNPSPTASPQPGGGTVTHTGSMKFTIGQRIVSDAVVNVRQSPGGALLGKQAKKSTGLVVAGPIYAVLPSSGHYFWWWNIDFASGSDGWVGEDNLKK